MNQLAVSSEQQDKDVNFMRFAALQRRSRLRGFAAMQCGKAPPFRQF
jgi:hypothetical protein